MADYAPDAATLAHATSIPEALAETVYARVVETAAQAVEDYRIDFEDGYADSSGCGGRTLRLKAPPLSSRRLAEGTLPPFCGIRIKPPSEEMKERGMRTLGRFLVQQAPCRTSW